MLSKLTFLIALLAGFEASAQCTGAGTCTQAAGGGAVTTVNAANLGGPCRQVTNWNSLPIMVPHGSVAEWSAAGTGFINQAISGVSTSACCVPNVGNPCEINPIVYYVNECRTEAYCPITHPIEVFGNCSGHPSCDPSYLFCDWLWCAQGYGTIQCDGSCS
jgi:hypothetical protein